MLRSGCQLSGRLPRLLLLPSRLQAATLFGCHRLVMETGASWLPHKRHFASDNCKAMNVFNRKVKKMQRDRAASADDYEEYNYLRNEIAERLTERLNVSITPPTPNYN